MTSSSRSSGKAEEAAPEPTAEQEAADAAAKEAATNVALAWRAEQQRIEAEEAGYEALLKEYDAEQAKAAKES